MATEEFPRKELETLWAPWRVEYFEKEPRNLNFLSEAAQASDDAGHLVITRRKNAFLISACVSRDEEVSERSGSQSAAPVPGEKIPDEGAYAPGPPGSSGSVRW